MPQTVYILCAATCLLCTILLAKGYQRTGARLLLWSCLCFLFLSLNNLLLIADAIFFPDTQIAFGNITFAVLRSFSALTGLLLLLFGLVWDSK
jgi:hypothetical protein